jgi:radical SAM enzyme (rSAM/lipoprotein system)
MRIPTSLRTQLLPLYRKSIYGLHDLRTIFFELTQKCNIACLHCGSDCTSDAATPDLPQHQILKTLEEIRSKYGSSKVMVVLSGGEPLCYPGLFELGKRIYSLGFSWGMVTNGFAWSRDTVEEALASGITSISVSLDGLATEHDWLRGRKGSFDRAARTIRLLTATRLLDYMDVITCVNKRNLSSLDQIHSLITDLGVKQWRLFTISPIGRASQIPELFLDGAQFRSLLAQVAEYRNQPGIKVAYSEAGYLGSAYEWKVREHHYCCMAGISVAGIMVNGDILACPNIDRRFRQGNVFSDSFVEVWEKQFKPFRDRNWMKTGECAECREWKRCLGNSFHLWDLDTNQTKLCYHRLLNTP